MVNQNDNVPHLQVHKRLTTQPIPYHSESKIPISSNEGSIAEEEPNVNLPAEKGLIDYLMAPQSKNPESQQQYEGGQLDTCAPMIDEAFEKVRASKEMKRQRLIEENIEQRKALKREAKVKI